MLRTRRGVILAVVAALLVALGAAGTWASSAADPMPRAMAALDSGDGVRVEQEPWLIFHPTDRQPEVGLVFYPGGRVDPRAYAPAARAIAAEGYLVVIVPMPFNLAVLASDRGADVIAAHPEVRTWAVGGHSLGGAMAARFARSYPDAVKGLVLWAAYPDGSDDLSGRSLRAVSVFGTLDGLATVEKIESSRPLLPADTRWVAIQGGNHAQFGWYGPQSGDGEASMASEEQQEQVIAATLELMNELREGRPVSFLLLDVAVEMRG
jgi:pimeloyl-ACP methyl ester carboxylesterase